MNDKLIELAILALKQGNSLDQVATFINLLLSVKIETTEIKHLEIGRTE